MDKRTIEEDIRLFRKLNIEDVALAKKYLVNVYKDLSLNNETCLLSAVHLNDYLNLPNVINQQIFRVFDRQNKQGLSGEDFVEGLLHLLTCIDLELFEFLFSLCDLGNCEQVKLSDIKYLLSHLDYPDSDFSSEMGVLEYNSRKYKHILNRQVFKNVAKNSKLFFHFIKCIYEGIPISSDSMSVLKIDKQFKTMYVVDSPRMDPFLNINEGENLNEEETLRSIKLPALKKSKKMRNLSLGYYLTQPTSSDKSSFKDPSPTADKFKTIRTKKEEETIIEREELENIIYKLSGLGRTSKNVRLTHAETLYESAYEGFIHKMTESGKFRKFWITIINKDMFYFNSTKEKFIGLHHLSKCLPELGEKKHLDNRNYFSFYLTFKNKKRTYYCESHDEAKNWITSVKRVTGYKEIDDFYKLSETVVGKGHYGVVYLGTNIRTEEKVAVKVIEKKKLREKGLDSFYCEPQILKICKHRNLLKLLDMFETSEHYYLVTDYYAGGSLSSVLYRRDFLLREPQIKNVILQIAKGVKYLGDRGIIHRDLKLENILLDDFAEVKIVDFGLSRVVSQDEKVFEEFGTLTYVAPEVLQKKGYNKEVDVWSIGIILYFLLVGKLPFTDPANDKQNIAQKIFKREISIPKSVINTTSPFGIDLMKRCLSEQNHRISIDEFLCHAWFDS